MPTIEQVSKRLFSDPNWLKKTLIGGVLLIFPVIQILALGYLFKLFERGRRQREFELPEWEWAEWKTLALDGLKFLGFGLVFAVIPIAVMMGLTSLLKELLPFGTFVARVPLIPVVFLAGPVLAAEMYLFTIRQELRDCLNGTALRLMLTGSAQAYAVPTLAYLGLLGLCWVVLPFAFFFGSAIYFYQMGFVYKELEKSKRK